MPEVKAANDVSVLSLVPDGKERIRMSLRKAMQLKSVVCDNPTTQEVKTAIEQTKDDNVVEYRKAYHYKEVHRRRKGVFEIAKHEIIEHIGSRAFTIIDPKFREICSWHGYNPSSLAGTLVKCGFVDCIGNSKHRTKSNNNSRYRVYRIKPQH